MANGDDTTQDLAQTPSLYDAPAPDTSITPPTAEQTGETGVTAAGQLSALQNIIGGQYGYSGLGSEIASDYAARMGMSQQLMQKINPMRDKMMTMGSSHLMQSESPMNQLQEPIAEYSVVWE